MFFLMDILLFLTAESSEYLKYMLKPGTSTYKPGGRSIFNQVRYTYFSKLEKYLIVYFNELITPKPDALYNLGVDIYLSKESNIFEKENSVTQIQVQYYTALMTI